MQGVCVQIGWQVGKFSGERIGVWMVMGWERGRREGLGISPLGMPSLWVTLGHSVFLCPWPVASQRHLAVKANKKMAPLSIPPAEVDWPWNSIFPQQRQQDGILYSTWSEHTSLEAQGRPQGHRQCLLQNFTGICHHLLTEVTDSLSLTIL